MRMPRVWLLALLAWGALGLSYAHAQAPQTVPTLKRHVTDLAGVLSPAEIGALERKLLSFESQRGSQIAILIVPTVEPEDIDQYSIRVVDENKLGRAKIDDGILILLAMKEAQLRIEVGRGLEGAVPDVAAGRIRREIMNPQFRAGKFYAGLNAGVDTIVRLVEGEELPPARKFESERPDGNSIMPILLMVTVFGSAILRALFGRLFGSAATGGLAGLLVWLLVGSIVGAGIAVVLGFIFSLVFASGGIGRGGFGGFGGMGGRGGWGGGGGFGGGGWGGGGGGFGGGGSSGSWR